MAVGVAAHHGADTRPPGRLRERGERRPALEARPLGVDEDRVEVVEVPERVVAPGIGLLPQSEELRPLDGLPPGLDAEADRRGGHAASYTESTRGGKRWSMRCVRLLVGLFLLALSAAPGSLPSAPRPSGRARSGPGTGARRRRSGAS